MTNILLPECPAKPTPSAVKPRRKVLHIVNGQHYAGAARVQDLLAMQLPAFGYDVSFACVLPDRFESQRQSQFSPLSSFPMRHRMDFSPSRQIADWVADEAFDIIHSHETRSAMIATYVAKRTKRPYVHHVHCQMNTEVGQRLKTMVNTAIERLACRRADRVIAVSGSIQRFLIANGFTKTEITVVPNGVPAPADPRLPRTSSDPWTIGMIALLRQRKGLETLLHALPRLADHHNVRLRIVGPFETPAYEHETMMLVDRLKVRHLIDWTGFVRNVPPEIAKMDVLVLPSVLAEGMPMVLLEAMSAGVPIVGSDVDGITDVIRNEQNGLLTEPGNADCLTSQLRRIITGKTSWQALRQQCLQDYAAMYSDVVMAGNIARVYDEILADHRNLTFSPITKAITR